ncbi:MULTISPECIES: hypothetical protein [Staphylococcus]|jgi:hypothetical protein|nr:MULTISPECIES: hypothetical protein [Staphylococcus]EID36465.1 hypothetical protein IS250_0557 [Staphylococcus epidermidis IS-250]MCG1155637.1 hypothetical protein [Staphylococcus epidermidis]MCG1196053.1 hypothetical protein [Staphylococcus epidermidis]MCG1327268.1 hypothetical protein [Staphylococcus epidermidis]MCG1491708.1 hypothetical protein [Staphylococcus epidermidis]
MNKLQLIKIALLTALLVEEVRNAKGETKYNYDSINGKWKRKGKGQKFS